MLDGAHSFCLTVRHFYLPFVRRLLPYEKTESVHATALPNIGGQWRIWGTTDVGYWYGFDIRRPARSMTVMLEISGRGTPAFTPKDPDKVASIIEAELPGAR